jgi:aspartyl-tRNA(Asn)/glutamyl-tRNA(Gln) amidotransferase subunit B
MFCDSKNDPHAGEPNAHVCPICMGHPGTLPVINEEAVHHVLKVGLALGGTLASYTEFDRKKYFYPDIPKGYQISQYLYPLVQGGVLKDVAITRVHLEEDTARSLHDQGEGSIVDYNRAGVPLMELVTEPVIHDAKTAGDFARELQLLLRTLGVSDANMEKGEMRVEANISISSTDAFGTKVEVKNLNSFKAVEGAISHEISRQMEVLESGEKVIQETRGWNEAKNKTFSQRVKESAHDYRYFPDPDLPSLFIDDELLSRIADTMPELPEIKREKYRNLGITSEQIEVMISDKKLDDFFKKVIEELGVEKEDVLQLGANYIVTDLLPAALKKEKPAEWHADRFATLMRMLGEKKITSRIAKDLLSEAVFEGIDPAEAVLERGLLQNDSKEAIIEIVAEVIAQNPAVADDYRGGKASALQFLVGQGMKLSKGTANPTLLAEILQEQLSK